MESLCCSVSQIPLKSSPVQCPLRLRWDFSLPLLIQKSTSAVCILVSAWCIVVVFRSSRSTFGLCSSSQLPCTNIHQLKTHLSFHLADTSQHAHALQGVSVWVQLIARLLFYGNLAFSQNLIHPDPKTLSINTPSSHGDKSTG